jgi:protein involved in polysaccharide export with SLBB domain
MTSFCPRKVLNDSDNILLQRDDSVYIASVLTMKEKDSVYVSGEVISPNAYAYANGMTLKDLLVLANGFNYKANLAEVEVYRQITDIKTLNENVIKAKTFKIRMDQEMDLDDAATFLLKREDHVVVRSIFGAEDLKQVSIEGEVVEPGNYILTSKDQHVSDLLNEAGGLTAYAYPSGAMLIRKNNATGTKKLLEDVTKRAIQKQQSDIMDTLHANGSQDLLQEPDMVAIDLHKIMMHPGSPDDLLLLDGDILSIPKMPETVTISGEVLMPAMIRYQKGKSLLYYIRHSGGFSSKALERKTYVIYPNGSMDATSSFLGIKTYPEVMAGSRIVVPAKPIKQGLNTAESISITSTLVSLMIVLLTFFKK